MRVVLFIEYHSYRSYVNGSGNCSGNKRLHDCIKGAGGLHQDFPEIDFLVVSDRGE